MSKCAAPLQTTTFRILTGETLADAGSALIGGVDVTAHPAIGYCPQVSEVTLVLPRSRPSTFQFDAVANELTGREILTLFATLNGFDDVKRRVTRVLCSIHLSKQADKIARFYSGGQKRRLSIGVTLMAKASLIMLDEPTAGKLTIMPVECNCKRSATVLRHRRRHTTQHLEFANSCSKAGRRDSPHIAFDGGVRNSVQSNRIHEQRNAHKHRLVSTTQNAVICGCSLGPKRKLKTPDDLQLWQFVSSHLYARQSNA